MPSPPRARCSRRRSSPPRTSCSARSRSPRKSACTRTRTSRFWSFDGRADPHTRRQAARCTGCTRRDATVARGAAAPEDRGRAGPLHRGPGGGEEGGRDRDRSEEHTSELQSHHDLVCRLLLEKKKKTKNIYQKIITRRHN